MKPTPKSPPNLAPLLAFGAHPDDIEFAVGAIIAAETRAARPARSIICSNGESATHGTPAQRRREAKKAAAILGATLEFIELDGDAHLEYRAAHAIKLAAIIRRVRPAILLAPTTVENQHPDHARLGHLVRDAARLARYGGIKELKSTETHAIDHLFFYAITPQAEPANITPLLIDISPPQIISLWTQAMNAHASQTSHREYIELQLTRARLRGLSAAVGHAIALFPSDPLVLDSLPQTARSARRF